MIEFAWWSAFFAIINISLWVGIIYFIVNFAIKIPKRIKHNEEKIRSIELLLKDIQNKLE